MRRASARHRSPGDAEHAEALAAQRLEASPAPDARRAVERPTASGPSSLVRGRAAGSTSSGAPFTTSSRSPAVVDQHRDAPPLEVERHLVDLAPADDVDSPRARGSRRRAGCAAGLEEAVEVGELQHALADRGPARRGAARARMRASVSVPVLSVHRTSMLPRSWIAARRLTITLLLGHAQRAARQRHRHDHRQQLGRQPDRERHGEQERLEQRPVESGVHEQHEQHQHEGQAHDQQAERRVPRSNAVGGGFAPSGRRRCRRAPWRGRCAQISDRRRAADAPTCP